jgi:hypothetical protein
MGVKNLVQCLSAEARPGIQHEALAVLFRLCNAGSRLGEPIDAQHDTVVGGNARSEQIGRETVLAVARAGAIPFIVRIMKNGDSAGIKHHAAVTLLFMSPHRDCAATIMGCPDAILTLASRTGPEHFSQARTTALGCLGYLAAFVGRQADPSASDSQNEAAAASDIQRFHPCIRPCVALLSDDNVPWLRRGAVDILAHITSRGGSQTCGLVYDAGAAIHLVRMLTLSINDDDDDLLWTQQQAVVVLGNLAEDTRTHGVLFAIGAIKKLIPLLTMPILMQPAMGDMRRPGVLQCGVAMALSNLAKSEPYAAEIGKAGAFPALNQLRAQLRELSPGRPLLPEEELGMSTMREMANHASVIIFENWVSHHRCQPGNSPVSYPEGMFPEGLPEGLM